MKPNINRVVYIVFALFAVLACLPSANLLEPTATPLASTLPVDVVESPLPEPISTIAVDVAPSPTSTRPAAPTPATSLPELYTFIQAPEGLLAEPYVILLAFQSIPGVSIEISGYVNSREFVCNGAPCAVPVPLSSQIVFQARSSAGSDSEQISAVVRVVSGDGGYYVYLDSVSQFSSFSDACYRYWGIQDNTNPVWAQFVQFPYLLNTNKTLHHLTTQLIIHGLVDVNGCPAGGLSIGLDWPTGCGLERARPTMIEWQNQFDEYIWLASKEVGIPPKILKTLIEVESQFWPGNQRFYLDEIGLGQINQLGADVLLRRNPQVYQNICAGVLDDCMMPYALQSRENQALIRGAFVSSQNAVCADCPNGLDMETAKQSITFIAQVLKANCETVKVVVDQNLADDLDDDWEDPYADLWKLTLLAYHSGVSCFEYAVKETAKDNIPLSWENVAGNIVCKGGVGYVDGLWGNLQRFDSYRYSQTDHKMVEVAPVFAPTPTPYPTPILSSAQVKVQVFLDANQNGVVDDTEWMDGVSVRLEAEDGTRLTATTVNGQVTFDLSSIRANIGAEVSLPGLYRSEEFTIPARGVVSLNFIFEQPTLPTAIP